MFFLTLVISESLALVYFYSTFKQNLKCCVRVFVIQGGILHFKLFRTD